MKEYNFYVYIITNYKKTVLYIGMTNNLIRRLIEHKYELKNGFTKKYHLKYLIYFENYQYSNKAIIREKELKGWTRQKKVDLIKEENPDFKDLSEEFLGDMDKKEILGYVKEIKETDPSLRSG